MFEDIEIELGDFIIVLNHFVILVPAILLYTVIMIDKLRGENNKQFIEFIIGAVITILITSGAILLLEFYFQDVYKEQKLEKLEKLDNDTSLTKGCEECCFRRIL